ncbi:ras association domain-containing protein 6 isoform X2 [Bombina bombina]|uniref:ras association domain-containing protein 6 isoform X2 n=1 Tax=Bombina bombina TaxID=8345 RepID=UPI00235AB94A|nr:ras association domain-containing protein 6 isoform X2 [Bombina bombina]
MANNSHQPSWVFINEKKYITRSQLDALLKTYNCYYKTQENLQMSYCQAENGQIIVSGLIDILWGVQRPIRFKMQDEKCISTESIQLPEVIGSSIAKSGMMRWGEFDDLYRISEETTKISDDEAEDKNGYSPYDSSTLRPKLTNDPDSPSLYRTMSDAALVKKRIRPQAPGRANVPQHRFSINGHFYNYQTSIFTPAFGSETKVMIDSNMKTEQVIEQLLRKFMIETSPKKKKLKNSDCPLWERLLQGPSGHIARMYLMDKEVEEISSDVAQYIKFNLPLLESILKKLNDEEEMEIKRTINKYLKEKVQIQHYLNSKIIKKTETTV